jgi:arsenate reductase (glutaredoxin)
MNILYHNPRCSKSRQTLALLEEHNASFEVVEYLNETPSPQTLQDIVNKLGFSSVHQLIRTKEVLYKELNVVSCKDGSKGLLELLSKNPKLIERPIFVTAKKAAIGRPPESVLALL